MLVCDAMNQATPRPRAARSVASIIGLFPERNSLRTHSLSSWHFSPCTPMAGHPSMRNLRVSSSTLFFDEQKHSHLFPSNSEVNSCVKDSNLSASEIVINFWEMFELAFRPAPLIVTRAGLLVIAPARDLTSSGHVADHKRLWCVDGSCNR
jgi:hypothetical protein